MNILALDLGTSTGFCHTIVDGHCAGTWVLATDKEVKQWHRDRTARRKDPRIARLYAKLLVVRPEPDVVVFEDVQFQTYTYQTQLWASFRSALWLSFAQTRIEAVPVGTLKKFATGYDKADKATMLKYLIRRFPHENVMGLDDNAVDAIWLYKWAKQYLEHEPQK